MAVRAFGAVAFAAAAMAQTAAPNGVVEGRVLGPLGQPVPVAEVRVVGALPKADAPVSIVGGFKLMLEVEIDKGAEKARLEKERARLSGEIARAQGNLGNPKFVDKAPPHVVKQMRERMAKFETELNDIMAQLRKLAG